MDIFQCIQTKRSVRSYEQRPVSNEDMQRLIELGTMAATGSGMEPWGFVVIQNREEITHWSEKIRTHLLAHMQEFPYLAQYQSWLENPAYCVFNHAPTLLVIYADRSSHWRTYDGTLAAGNIMLAAHEMGIGPCWIGFAEYMLNTPEFKQQYHVPEHYELICPMSMGYMKEKLAQNRTQTYARRKKPVVFYQG